jgi:hypothetical protein
MASLVNPFNINGNYPIAGQDNDSQGFRDNFTNIKNNFVFIKQEVEDLQNKAILKSALSGTTLDNNFQGSAIKNIQTKNQSETVYDWGEKGGVTATEIQLDLALGNIHKLVTVGSVKINTVIKNWPGSLQYARLLLYINVGSVSHTLEIPSNLTTDLSALPGLRTVTSSNLTTFTDAGNYIYEFSSVDSGTTIFVRELTKGNPVFRDPNFYMAGMGTYSQPSLRLGWGNLFALSAKIDSSTKSGTDVFSVRGGVTSFMNHADAGNNPALMKTAGFSVAKSRTVDPGAGITNPSETVLQTLDYVGYFNALGYTKDVGVSTYSYQALGSIGFYATGSDNSIGGNVVISTKTDGGSLSPAITIDNAQNVVIYGGLDVKGTTTTVESTILTVADKNIVMGVGTTTEDLANGGGIQIVTGGGTFANLLYVGPAASQISNGVFSFNKGVNVDVATTSTNSKTGALIVAGGVGIAENLNGGGTFGLTSTTESTNTTTAAFTLLGGMSTAKNIIAGGNLFANSTSTASNLVSGAFQVTGGALVKGNLYVGGQTASGPTLGGLYVLAGSASTSSDTGALVVKGGVGVAGNVYLGAATSANGVVVSSTLDTLPAMLYANNVARTATQAFRVKGGTMLEGNVVIGTGVSTNGILYIDNAINPSVAADGTIDTTKGGVVLGNASSYVGMYMSGDFFLGGTGGTTGTIYTMNKEAAIGGPTIYPLKPNETSRTGGNPTLAAVTALGGTNILGNLYVGQPHDGTDYNNSTNVWSGSINAITQKPVGANSGNIIVNSGTPSQGVAQGALVIGNVQLINSTNSTTGAVYSAGGIGVAGNAYIGGNVVLGQTLDLVSNVTILSTANSPIASIGTGALTVRGGVGVTGNLNVGANVTINNSGLTGYAHLTVLNGNIVAGNAQPSWSSSTGALVVTGGAGISGNVNLGANLAVAGQYYPINAVGASGAVVVRGDGGNVAITSTSLVSPVTSGTSTASTISTTTTTVTGSIAGTTLTTSAGSPAVGQFLYGTGIIPGTYILSGSGTSWVVSISQAVASTTFTAVSTILTIGGTVSAGFYVGTLLSGTNVTPGTQIIAVGTGTSGGAGTYIVNIPQTAASAAINGSQGTLSFLAEANKSYYFEAYIFHDASTVLTKGFGVTFSAGICVYYCDQQVIVNGVDVRGVSSVSGTAIGSVGPNPLATTGGAAGGPLVAKVYGTFTSTTSVPVTVQMQTSAGTLTVRGHSYLRWTRLF